MAIQSTGSANVIVAVVNPRPKLTAVFGSVYISSSSGSVTITSPKGTITVGGTASNPTLDLAQQGAVSGQVLAWNGTKYAPSSVIGSVYSGSGAPSFTPSQVPAIYFDTTTTFIYEWATGATSWVKASGSALALQVDGIGVTPTNNAINFADSTAQFNRILFSNPSGNKIVADFDFNSPLITSEVTIQNLAGTAGVTLDYPNTGVTNYDLVFPPAQGLTGQTLVNDGSGNLMWQTISGGGGGGTFSSTAIWTGGTNTKDAFTSPGVVNNAGITLTLVASSGSGGITNATISLNGVALAGTFNSTGTWPNLSIAIPSATLIGNAAEIAPTVIVSLTGTFNSSGVNISNAGTLMNNQPVPFSCTLSGSYALTSAPYYTTTGTLNYSYTNSAAITSFGGVFTPGGNATSPSGSFNNIALTGSTISGSVTGNGLYGAGPATITLSGSVPAVPSFIPAFWAQTLTNVPPTFTTSSNQTSSAAQGSTITYTLPSTMTSYNWVVTQRPLANLMLRTSFGSSVLVPDVTAPNQTIAGQTFSVYGYTGLSLTNPSVLVIS